MKILNSDSQYVFSIILVEKLRFVRPNWNILFEITYESKLTLLILCKLYHFYRCPNFMKIYMHKEDVFDLLF